jgi:phosphatidylglycerol:prolipoprotein diacylglycerol transferase
MIPYLDIPPLVLGPISIHPFGVLAVIAILVGSWVTLHHARRLGIDEQVVRSALWWILVGGFVGAHLVAVLAYEPEKIAADPLLLLKVWKGLSSTGGFVGALVGLLLFARVRREPIGRIADVVALGLLPGWIFGRLGCYLAHDHPGTRSDFFLAVSYPGGARHDLGFYEMLVTAGLFLVFELVRRVTRLPGRVALLVAVAYAPVRFLLDFLRAADRLYLGLTPAQYACIGMFLLALAALGWQKRASRTV